MAVYFLDASAFEKRYIQEAGSIWMRAITDPQAGNSCWLAAVARVEMVAAIYRRVRMGDLAVTQAQSLETLFQHDLRTHFHLLLTDEGVLNRATRLAAQHPLRAYDAIRLATGIQLHVLHQRLGIVVPTLLSSDSRILHAAHLEA
jgi:uncharacterized protein